MVALKITLAIALALAVGLPATTGASTPSLSPRVEPGTERAPDRSVTVLVVPSPLLPEDLSALPGAAVGLMSAGLGEVGPDQTWLDVSQGARAFDNKYDKPLNTLSTGPGFVFGWGFVVKRAASAAVPVVPGLLAGTLRRNGIVPASAEPAATPDPASLAVITPGGFIKPAPAGCPGDGCASPVTVSTASLAEAAVLMAGRGRGELMVVIEAPPVASGEQMAIAVAGPGLRGMLRSASTRTPGYVLSTDLAPTVLAHFGIPRPLPMSGSPIRSGGRVDFAALAELEGRYRQVGERRGTALLFPLLAWLIAVAAAFGFGGPRWSRQAARMLCLAVVLLPAALLVTAALSPSSLVESLVAGLLPVGLAALLLRALSPWSALATACAVTVGAFAVDLVAGLDLTPRAVIGPNPGLGARFYGIGNELESTLMILTSVGTGAALQARRGVAQGAAVAAFLVAGVAGTLVFASGRFGADVGAAIIFPFAAVVGAAVIAGRPRLIWLAALAAAAGVALLAVVDTVTGGETHFARSVLSGGSTESVIDVLAHRLEATWQSFIQLSRVPITLLALALVLLAWKRRERLVRLFERLEFVRAGVIAAAAGSLAGALTNDSGALFIQVGVLYLALTVAFTWACAALRTDP
jgi:hypothetical protein